MLGQRQENFDIDHIAYLIENSHNAYLIKFFESIKNKPDSPLEVDAFQYVLDPIAKTHNTEIFNYLLKNPVKRISSEFDLTSLAWIFIKYEFKEGLALISNQEKFKSVLLHNLLASHKEEVSFTQASLYMTCLEIDNPSHFESYISPHFKSIKDNLLCSPIDEDLKAQIQKYAVAPTPAIKVIEDIKEANAVLLNYSLQVQMPTQKNCQSN